MNYNGITVVGYTNIESRMASTASSLFAGNVTNLLLTMQDKKDKKFIVDLQDPAVRSMLCVHKGEALAPYVPPAAPPSSATTKDADKKKEAVVLTPEQIRQGYVQNTMYATATSTTALALASMVPNAPMMSTFALSCWVGK